MPEERLITTPDVVTTVDRVELVPDQLLVGDTTALGQAPTTERTRVESDQALVGEIAQAGDGLADA